MRGEREGSRSDRPTDRYRRSWFVRLYLVLRFIIEAWRKAPLPMLGTLAMLVTFFYYFGFYSIIDYVPSPMAVYHFFRPKSHGCSQTFDSKSNRMVWSDDGSPADPPLAGYVWDTWNCKWMPSPVRFGR